MNKKRIGRVEWTDDARQAANFLCSMPDYGHTTLQTKDLRALLYQTGGQLLARGRLYNIVTRSLGAGIHHVSCRLANP
jgi:hypothetical protein